MISNDYDTNRQHLQDCVICETRQADGIHVLESFICSNCEMTIVNAEAGETGYMFYVGKLRKLQEQLNGRGPGAVQK